MSARPVPSASIDAPLDVVWAVMLDTAAYGEWNPFVYEVECPSPAKVGDPIKLHVRWSNGKTTSSPERITVIEPPHDVDGVRTALPVLRVRGPARQARPGAQRPAPEADAGAGRADAVRHRPGADRADGPVRRPGADRRRLRAARGRPQAAVGVCSPEAERAGSRAGPTGAASPARASTRRGSAGRTGASRPRCRTAVRGRPRAAARRRGGRSRPPPSRARARSRSPRRTPPAGCRWSARRWRRPASPSGPRTRCPRGSTARAGPAASPASRIAAAAERAVRRAAPGQVAGVVEHRAAGPGPARARSRLR